MKPAHSAAGLNERITPVKPGAKVYVLANFKTIVTVDLDTEPFKTHIPGLSLEGIDITRHPQTLTADRKFQMNTFITPSFRKVEPHLCPLLPQMPIYCRPLMPHPGGWGWRRLMNYFLFSRPARKGGVVDFIV
jgi:hypothetical protein